jgi:PIN domain nuclease of toxin-antitoxin system
LILLDTHIWYWWVSGHSRLTPQMRGHIEGSVDAGLGLSIVSCWEVAKKCSLGKLALDRPVDQWLADALQVPGLRLLPLTVEIVLDATALPDGFRSDPADELIVATARVLKVPLLTADARLLAYSHVPTL